MKAEVTEKFNGGYYLPEQSLKKIIDLFSTRVGSDSNLEIIAVRADHAKVIYSDLNELIQKEENSKTERIESLELNSSGAVTKMELAFKRGEKTTLKIESDDRDIALLLAADLRQYIRNEVVVSRVESVSRLINDWMFFPIFIMLMMVVGIFGTKWFSVTKPLNLKSATDSQKLDHLIYLSKRTQ